MFENFDPTTIVFALLAVFVLFKLRSVLGTKVDVDRPDADVGQHPNGTQSTSQLATDNVVRLPGAGRAANENSSAPVGNWSAVADTSAVNGLQEIASRDPGFEPNSFVNGAKAAYEMIVLAFAADNVESIKELLAVEVYDGFAAAIAGRKARGETVDTTFVSNERAMITEAQLRGNSALITVRFASKLITVTRDKNKTPIEGNADKVVDISDIWTFARDLTVRDPNWKLVATDTEHPV